MTSPEVPKDNQSQSATNAIEARLDTIGKVSRLMRSHPYPFAMVDCVRTHSADSRDVVHLLLVISFLVIVDRISIPWIRKWTV
jgi:hypothetical protein